jgi:hypothetical protein
MDNPFQNSMYRILHDTGKSKKQKGEKEGEISENVCYNEFW